MNRIDFASQFPEVTSRREKLHLRLYTGLPTFDSKAALSQVHSLLGLLRGSYEIEVLDEEESREDEENQARFTPVLVRVSPSPTLRLPMPQATSEALKNALLS